MIKIIVHTQGELQAVLEVIEDKYSQERKYIEYVIDFREVT